MAASERSDEALLALAARRDPDGLDELFDRYGGLAYSLALRIVREPSAAEDVVQEAFLSVWRRAASFDAVRGSVRGWLLTVVRNRAVDRIRTNQYRGGLDRTIEGLENRLAAPDAWPEVALRLDSDAIKQALDQLPAEQRATIEMAFFGGLTHVEIARQVGAPLGTIKGRMRIGLQKLRALLETAGVSPGEGAL